MTTNDKLDILQQDIIRLGSIAVKNQKGISTSLKNDGTILTESDLMVSDKIIERIRTLFPDCGIVSEETRDVKFKPDAPFNFVLDPIDGTDSYAQGMPMWCISLGILDNNRQPAGSIIYSPSFGEGTSLLFRTNPGEKEIYLNGKIPVLSQKCACPRQITIGSHTIREIDLSDYKGKIRSFGSTILHLVSPVLYCRIDAALVPRCYVWDIAGAHAIVKKCGFEVINSDGTPFVYSDSLLIDIQKFPTTVYCGKKETNNWLLSNIRVL